MAVPNSSGADFGSRMRHTREQRGVSLRQIAQTTKLSVSALEALERNDISRLPGGIFSRAFVRSYAAEIGIDPEDTGWATGPPEFREALRRLSPSSRWTK